MPTPLLDPEEVYALRHDLAPLINDADPACTVCGASFSPARWAIGKRTCLRCGEQAARHARASWCVAPLNKSNYVLVTDPALLAQLNPKRTT